MRRMPSAENPAQILRDSRQLLRLAAQNDRLCLQRRVDIVAAVDDDLGSVRSLAVSAGVSCEFVLEPIGTLLRLDT
ncbi:hypothetical protein PspLS_06293 [Pyricularia sp. CBS 133598]|nr:hypothetical protein PspLS_06293 [Pyricularia sp. CBS 133598]